MKLDDGNHFYTQFITIYIILITGFKYPVFIIIIKLKQIIEDKIHKKESGPIKKID